MVRQEIDQLISYTNVVTSPLSRTREKARDFISDHRVKGELTHCVMSTWEPDALVRNTIAIEFVVGLLGERRQERRVVPARQHQDFAIGSTESRNEWIGTDRRPEISQLVEIDCA